VLVRKTLSTAGRTNYPTQSAYSFSEDGLLKALMKLSIVPLLLAAATAVPAAQLSTDARSAVPRDLQQLVVVDYQAMENSPAAMGLRNRVMPPELKQLDTALQKSGLNDNHDVDQLAFALFHPTAGSETMYTVGIAEGEFSVPDILANFRKQKLKPTMVRSNSIYPMTKSGMVLCFVDPSTMIFGSRDAVVKALDTRDGLAPNMLSNGSMMNAMQTVDSAALWSILSDKGTQTMMKQLLGEAGSVTNLASVQQRLQACWYAMNFRHGVTFDLTVSTGDAFASATVSSLLSAAVMVRKMASSDAEKQALNATSITSNSGEITIHFASSDSEFSSLLQSPLFQSVMR
jgi:hypothetical protein